IGDVHSIGDIVIFQSGSAGDRGVRRTRCSAAGDTRRGVKQAGYPASYWNRLIEGIGKVGGDGSRGGIHRDRAAKHLHDFRLLAGYHADTYVRRLAGDDFDTPDVGRLEASLLHLDGIQTASEKRKQEI